MSAWEGKKYGENMNRQNGKNTAEKEELKNLKHLAIEYNLTGEELWQIGLHLVCIRAKKKGVKPEELSVIIDNWDRLKTLIDQFKKL